MCNHDSKMENADQGYRLVQMEDVNCIFIYSMYAD